MENPFLNSTIANNPFLLEVEQYEINPEGREECTRTVYIPITDIRYLQENWQNKCYDVFLKDNSSVAVLLNDDTYRDLRISLSRQM